MATSNGVYDAGVVSGKLIMHIFLKLIGKHVNKSIYFMVKRAKQ